MALKTPIIHCLLDAEPERYHAAPSLAVNLGFECPTDIARSEVIGDDAAAKARRDELKGDEALAKVRFTAFLIDAQTVQFHLFEARPDGPVDPTSYTLVHIGRVDTVSEPPAAGMPDQAMTWLCNANPADPKTHYWTTFTAAAEPNAAINAETAAATYRLRAAHSWNAPVAHRLHLTHILRPTGMTEPNYVILAFFSDPAVPVPDIIGIPGPQDIDGSERQWDFTYDAGGKQGEITCRTEVLDTATLFTATPDLIHELLTPDGYLRVDPEAEHLWRITTWFEARAASLMSTTEALAGPDTDARSVDEFDKLFLWTCDEIDKKPKLVAPAAAWLATTSLITALDAIVLSVLKPVSGDGSAGEILAPLVIVLLDRIEKKISDPFDLKASALDPAKVTGALRKALKAANPLFMQANVPPSPPDRTAIINCLRSAHGIDASAKDASVEIRLLDALLTCFGDDAPTEITPALKAALEDKKPAFLRRALTETLKKLQDEAGIEYAAIQLMEHTKRGETDLPALFAEAYLAEIKRPGEPALTEVLTKAFVEAWADYRTLLENSFNGAEAVRRGSASEFSKALLSFAKANPPVSTPEMPVSKPRHLITIAGAADYYLIRLLMPSEEPVPSNPVRCFRPIADSLLRTPPFTGFDPSGIDALKTLFQNTYAAAMAPMADIIEQFARFIPDTAPAPLPIQIASNIDGADIETFSNHFNGIGIAIRRIDTDDATDKWAHASLADLTWPMPPPDAAAGEAAPNVSAAIHPMLPAVSDGRGPMFIAYEGLPLAATTFGRTAADPVPEASGNNAPFYSYEAPDLDFVTDFAKVPRLAYGRTFEAFSFATTNAGTLPLALQRQAAPPAQKASAWMPDKEIKAPQKDDKPDPDLVSTTAYQRRTAIGQIALKEVPEVNRPRRIGAPIEDVVPVSEDYPRTVIASGDCPGVRDIFRDRDGTGTLSIPAVAAKKAEWRISETVFRGTPAKLTVRLFDRAPQSATDPGIASLELDFTEGFDFSAVNDLVFGVEPVETEAGDATRVFSATCGSVTKQTVIKTETAIDAGWIRLSLASAASASLSFAVTDDLKPYDVAAPLLLLAPADKAWKDVVNSSVTAEITAPRVGYLDFDRWFSNADLRDAAFPNSKPGGVNEEATDNLRRALLTAYVLRDTHLGLAGALDRLPDPAVDGLRVELAIQDQLGPSAPSSSFVHADIFFGQTLLAIAKTIKPNQLWTPQLLMSVVFQPIETAFTFTMSLTSGDFGLSAGGLRAGVPAGIAARLSIDALVANRHFDPSGPHPAVFHNGLHQHASRAVVQPGTKIVFLAFPSLALRIETMLNGMPEIDLSDKLKPADKPAIALAGDMVAVRPIDRTRRYDLETRAELPAPDKAKRTRQWRLLSEIDVTTQRWRPSGRPIYHHIDPLHFRDENALSDKPALASHVVMPLKEQPITDGHSLSRFEQEAFFDRPNIDSQTVTQRLLPLPSRTVLEQHFWEAPSASIFRHRFTLRSRYAGALKAVSHREVKAWNTSRETRRTPAEAWILRVAMLADLSRMLLTRPQQRALIPLTTAPRDDGSIPSAPPVLAILQEPPFSRGGLADRIAAEIKTGFGYGFEGMTDATVEILDSRKEIGPDPRLSYRPTEANAALGMALNAEGPIGLTFDQVNAPAPAFPNSMISLSPVQLSGEEQNLEEHFLGISMRRYIDPNWTIDNRPSDPSSLDAERCWWIDPDPVLAPSKELLGYTAHGIDAPLLKLTFDGTVFFVHTMKAAVDGMAGAADKDVVIARWERGFAENLSILHQPVAPGRYSTSVFVIPKENQGNVRRGRSNTPLLICNFEWGPPERKPNPKDAGEPGAAKGPVTVTLKASGAKVRSTMASAATFLAWTRMGRNFDITYSPDFATSTPVLRELPTRDLLGNIDSSESTLTLARSGIGETWLCSSTLLKPYPLHVQRHLAVLTTGYLREPGRPVEEYSRSALLLGRRSAHLSGIGGQEDCLRIVEFETPAAILCSSEVPAPETYLKAYFDLVATGFGTESGPASARLFFRFAGQPEHLRKFTTLRITLAYGNGGTDGGLVRHAIAAPLGNSDAAFAIGMELCIERSEPAAKLAYRSAMLMSDGETVPAQHPAPDNEHGLLGADNHNPGFFVSLAAEGDAGAGEFWTDVSLLHSPRPTCDGRFDFDWLFSKAGGAEPALDVAPAGLNTMVEAQARIIAVSPPVPIQPKPAD
ncbi:MAG TPA: hypothetical protein VL202_03220 [Pararhizobium sp.]|uniref:hypothetical protein n=1 Tax=Pararhizobium sp. TaxID=1977563 RepID=UPI002BD058A8|nr:hypothetical protein [Pararhizobium sp.]HTO30182.1 hypothetical protein [Pararhizobium sp.]